MQSSLSKWGPAGSQLIMSKWLLWGAESGAVLRHTHTASCASSLGLLLTLLMAHLVNICLQSHWWLFFFFFFGKQVYWCQTLTICHKSMFLISILAIGIQSDPHFLRLPEGIKNIHLHSVMAISSPIFHQLRLHVVNIGWRLGNSRNWLAIHWSALAILLRLCTRLVM